MAPDDPGDLGRHTPPEANRDVDQEDGKGNKMSIIDYWLDRSVFLGGRGYAWASETQQAEAQGKIKIGEE